MPAAAQVVARSSSSRVVGETADDGYQDDVALVVARISLREG
jgi:hypothetical protein